MSSQDDTLYQKWQTWLDVLDEQILNLHGQRKIYTDVLEMVQTNPPIQEGNVFFSWVAVWYCSSMSVGVRKQSDNDKDSISYRRLLEGIKSNPRVISRTRFKNSFVDGNYSEWDANLCFDQIVGPGLEYLDLNIVQNEIDELAAKTSKLTTYVNKRVAHHDKNEFTAVPKFTDLNDAIDHLGNLHRRYHGIFRCLSLDHLTPTFMYDWTKVFRYSGLPVRSITS